MSEQVYLGGGLTAVVMTPKEKDEAYTLTPVILRELIASIPLPSVREQIMQRFEDAAKPNLLKRIYYHCLNKFGLAASSNLCIICSRTDGRGIDAITNRSITGVSVYASSFSFGVITTAVRPPPR